VVEVEVSDAVVVVEVVDEVVVEVTSSSAGPQDTNRNATVARQKKKLPIMQLHPV